MTNEDIIKQAIEKAKSNGWETDIISRNEGFEGDFIFSHDFAKAFWINSKCECGGRDDCFLEPWQYHLQQMVLEQEPLKYIEKFLDDNISTKGK